MPTVEVSAPKYSPATSLAQPRTSSKTSGLRFCGIKLEPVDDASPNRT